MPNELGVTVTRTPVVADPWAYVTLRRNDGYVWRRTTAAAEPFNQANAATYDVPLTADGGGEYRGDIPTALPPTTGEQTWKAIYWLRASSAAAARPYAGGDEWIADGDPFTWTGTSIGVPVPAGGWRYSDRSHVLAIIDNANAAIIFDLNADEVEDAGLMTLDGINADTYIDRFLLSEGFGGVPIDTTTASSVVVQSLADIGAHLTVWYGYTHRGMARLLDRGGNAASIAGEFAGFLDYADRELPKLLSILRDLYPDNINDELIPAMQAIVPTCEQVCGYPWGYG